MAFLDPASQVNLIKLQKVQDMGLMALVNRDEKELQLADGTTILTEGLLELRWSEKDGKEVWTSSFGVMERLSKDIFIGGFEIGRHGLEKLNKNSKKPLKEVNAIYSMKSKKQKKDLEKQFLSKPPIETTSLDKSEKESLKILGKPNATSQSTPRSISQWTSYLNERKYHLTR